MFRGRRRKYVWSGHILSGAFIYTWLILDITTINHDHEIQISKHRHSALTRILKFVQ
jgi:hypothetical protein